MLGRWSSDGSDEYVRCYKTIVRNLTLKLQEAAREEDAFSHLGEGEAADEIRHTLERKSVDKEAAERFAEKLASLGKQFFKDLAGQQGSPKPPVPAQLPDPPAEEESADEDPGQVLVSTRRGGDRRRTLHMRGGCYHSRELLFSCYEVFNDRQAAEGLFDSVCGKCWPHARDETSGGSSDSPG